MYEIDGMIESSNVIPIIVLLFNSFLIIYIYLYKKQYMNLMVIPQIISLLFFMTIWSDIADKFSMMDLRDISYTYLIVFYLIIIGTFSNIVIYILYTRKEAVKREKKKVTYVTNKETGCVNKQEIR